MDATIQQETEREDRANQGNAGQQVSLNQGGEENEQN